MMEQLEIEGAKIVFRNFAGQGTPYNREGSRNFSVVIPNKEAAIAYYNAGWNVSVKGTTPEDKEALRGGKNFMEKVAILNQRGTDNDALYHLRCNVNLESKSPAQIFLIAGKNRKPILMTKETVAQIDVMDIAHCDLVIRPYHWSTPTGGGITAYLKTMYVVINEDPFAAKYAFDEYDE